MGWAGRRPQVEVVNPRRGGRWMVLVRAALVLALWAPLPAGLVAGLWAADFAQRVPPTPDVSQPLAGHASSIWSTDRTRLGGLLRGRRPWVAYERIPARVKFAFLAAEDDAFFEHDGFDLIAIARAFLRNRAAGRVVEGGSTITQQLAKRYLGSEKKYERKIVELLLSRRIEATTSKDRILEAYLNEIYLGAGAYGVAAAAEIYFDKNLDELDWPEVAMIAAMTSSPSSWNPFRRPARAQERRRLILLRLSKLGVLTLDEAESMAKAPLDLRQSWDGDEDTAPYAAVEVREAMQRDLGDEVMAHGSVHVTLSLSPTLQRHGRRALDRGLRDLDRRQGYRGPLATLPAERWSELASAAAEVYGVPEHGGWQPEPERPYVAVVTEVLPRSLEVQLAGRAITIPYEGAAWASPYARDTKDNEQVLEDMAGGFAHGDVVLVAWGTHTFWSAPPRQRREEPVQVTGWRVDQVPRVEGALVSAEIDTGYVRALVGGWDFDRSQYNRAIVGCRQPGSVFKPIVYSAALDKGMTPATLLTDAPVKVEKAGGEVWTPKNADNDFSGFLLMRDALARSRNLPSFQVFSHAGVAKVIERAKRLGITTPMAKTEALSLGASCVKPWDMVRVYGAFARQGVRMEPHLVLTMQRQDGEVLSDVGHFADPSAPTLARLDRLARAALSPPPRVLRPSTAYMMLSMLRAVVYAGTAYAATALGVQVAGKTGTTNAFDAWFIGFTRSLVTSVWVGADNNDRALGRRESGGRVALPVWMRYMGAALADRPQGALQGEPPEDVELHRIDRGSGFKVRPGEPGVDLPFRAGTAPTQFAPIRQERDAQRVDRISSEF